MTDSVETERSLEIGKWIREKRESKGWSLAHLSERTGGICTPQYLSQIERGITGKKNKPRKIDEEIIEAIAVALGESVNEARDKAGYSALDESYRGKVLKDFADALHDYHNLSENSRKFAKKHFAETIDFLLSLDKENEPEKTGKEPLIKGGRRIERRTETKKTRLDE